MNHRKLLDMLTEIKLTYEKEMKVEKIERPTAEDLLDLKFKAGDRVIDTITGKEVEIIGRARTYYHV